MADAHDHFINGQWIAGNGAAFQSHNPATGVPVWQGSAAASQDVDRAVTSARQAFENGEWTDAPLETRINLLESFASQMRDHQSEIADSISQETGKPLWEAAEEAGAMINKIALSIKAHAQRRADVVLQSSALTTATRFKPHGVVAVFGPFNFPGHLPNGHIVPALLAGNTVVFKPSEMTPGVAKLTVELWQASGISPGVLNLIQGGRETGIALAAHPGLDGLFFTGSAAAGLSLHRQFAGDVRKILALEMGGNNPLIAWDASDTTAAACMIIQSAFLTAGQRCTCARRLILPAAPPGDAILDRLISAATKIRIGPPTLSPEPFMGPVISPRAADQLLIAQDQMLRQGGISLVPMSRIGDAGAFLRPGIVDVTSIPDRSDAEHFGPLLQVIRVNDFEAAIAEANRTAYGLSAGLLSDDPKRYDAFRRRIRAGIVNWNRPITGASGSLPFGGIGLSGNHRPSGYYAADYCSYAVASMETPSLSMPTKVPPGLADAFSEAK